jgi:uncharacterized DUF497 family protein
LLPLLFDWDTANIGRVGRHVISPEEAEEALLDLQRFGVGTYGGHGERRSAYVGSTEEGRVLLVVTTTRRRRVRVVTARDTTELERRWYRRRRAEA